MVRPLKGGRLSGHKHVGAFAAAKQKGTKAAAKQKCTNTAVKKPVTPRMASRRSTSTTPGSSRHSTPHHSTSDDYTSPRNPTYSSHRERVTRSSASPGISILNVVELDLCCSLRYT